MTQREANEENLNESKLAILKQRYELLEKTLANVEKEKEYYRVGFRCLCWHWFNRPLQDLYERTKKDLEHIEEKYLKAKKLIKELQDR